METKHPTFGNGKICYLEIPALNVQESSEFYKDVFGWHIRADNQGNVTFDDGVMEVSGSWVVGRKPMTEPGIMISIMVDHADATMKLITEHGGKIVYTEKMGADEFVASFTDPAGNLMVIYESARLK